MARVRIILDEKDDEAGSTWVSIAPVRSPTASGVWDAVDEASRMFKFSVAQSSDVIWKRLSDEK